MTFSVSANAYDQFMGRYSVPLAALFADFAAVSAGQRVLDVGCGPGALTSELVRRLGAESVSAVDPSASFIGAARERFPGAHIRQASAEHLPFKGAEFDACLAQLVVHFMSDPIAGIREMRRVTRAGGRVVACVWDHEGGTGPLSPFWEAVNQLDAAVPGEAGLAGAREGHLAEIFREAGFTQVEEGSLVVTVEHRDFDDWWTPFTLGVGPAGGYTMGLDESRREQLQEQCRALLGAGPFAISGRAWAARGVA